MQLKTAVIAAMLLSSSAFVVAEEKHHWGYSGEGAPKNWGKLDPAFVTQEMEQAGWKLIEEKNILPYQYYLIFEPLQR